MSDKAKEELKKKIFLAKLSASKMRGFAGKDDIESFSQGLPIGKGFTMDDAKRLMKAVQMFGQKNEDYNRHEYKQEISEMYREGRLYEEGDWVESLVNGLEGRIHRCGANHLIVVTEDNIMFKSFIHDVHLI